MPAFMGGNLHIEAHGAPPPVWFIGQLCVLLGFQAVLGGNLSDLFHSASTATVFAPCIRVSWERSVKPELLISKDEIPFSHFPKPCFSLGSLGSENALSPPLTRTVIFLRVYGWTLSGPIFQQRVSYGN